MRKILDKFTDLPLSPERKRQLRKRAIGLCVVAGCDNKLDSKNRCCAHLDAFNYYKKKLRAKRGKVATGD